MNLFAKFFKQNSMRLVDAILSGNIRQVRKLLKEGADANTRIEGESGYPLHFASHSYVNMMQLLIDNGADVNVKDERGKTPLHIAAFVGYEEGVRLLLQHGANVNARDNDGMTPLAEATQMTPLQAFGVTIGAPPSADEIKEEEDRRRVARLLKSHGAQL